MSHLKGRRAPISVAIVFVRGMVGRLAARGEPVEECLVAADIAPALLDEPAARVTADQYIALYRALIDRFDDEGVGQFARPLRSGSLGFIMRSAMGSRTVEAALARICKAFTLLMDDVVMSLHQEGGQACVRMVVRPGHALPHSFAHELLLRVLLRQVSWLSGARLKGLAFDFAIPAQPYLEELRKLFPGELRFGQPCTALCFDAGVLAAPLRHDSAALREFIAGTPGSVISPERFFRAVSARVRNTLLQARPDWLGVEEVAEALHVAVSTLQRQLLSEGTTFQALKDELRRDIAIQRLGSSAVPLAALAQELGFSDSATFQRAFKGWTGSAAGAYRQGMAKS